MTEVQESEAEVEQTRKKKKQLKAKLLKIRTAAFQFSGDRKGVIDKSKETGQFKETRKLDKNEFGNQDRVSAEVDFINTGTKIRPPKGKIDSRLRKKLAMIDTGEVTRENAASFMIRDKKEGQTKKNRADEGKALRKSFSTKRPLNPKVFGGDKMNTVLKRKLAQTSEEKFKKVRADIRNAEARADATELERKKRLNIEFTSPQNKLAKNHGHTIVVKKASKGVYRTASLEGQQGKYAKYWLLNAKQTNGNGWGIAAHSASQNMSKFIGRPLVVTSAKWHGASVYGDKFDHPFIPTNDLNQIFAHQEQFRVGNIVDIGEKNGDFYATVEMLPKFANMSLPPFCSPAIYQLNAKESEGNISEWEALHLAALDENPAYGARIALLKGTCVGTANSCAVQFKSAKLVGRPGESKTNTIKRKAGELLSGSVVMKDGEEKDQFNRAMDAKIICPFKKARLLKLKLRLAGTSTHGGIPKPVKITAFGEAKKRTTPEEENDFQSTKTPKSMHGFGQRGLKDPAPKVAKKKQRVALIKKFAPDDRDVDAVKDRADKIDKFLETPKQTERFLNNSLKNSTGKPKHRQMPEGLANEEFMRDGTKIDPSKFEGKRIDTNLKRKLAKLKFKLASLGEQNMTFQESKKIKIHKKKHPEVRKAKSAKGLTVDEALRGIGRSVDASHAQSTFLSEKGDFIGGRGPLTHIQQISNLTRRKSLPTASESDDIVTQFSAENRVPRVQVFPIDRSGTRKVSVGIHSKINNNQLKSLQDLEKGGKEIGFGVGPNFKNIVTGTGTRDLTKVLREHKFL